MIRFSKINADATMVKPNPNRNGFRSRAKIFTQRLPKSLDKDGSKAYVFPKRDKLSSEE
jgi:hypothetical protein